jgi:hypothetical protein
MTTRLDISKPLPGAAFGATVRLAKSMAKELPDDLPAMLADAGGLLLIPGLGEITAQPELLVKLRRGSPWRTRRCPRSSWSPTWFPVRGRRRNGPIRR